MTKTVATERHNATVGQRKRRHLPREGQHPPSSGCAIRARAHLGFEHSALSFGFVSDFVRRIWDFERCAANV